MRKVLALIGLAFVSFAGMARAQEAAPAAEAPAADAPAVAPAADAPAAAPAAAPAGYPDEYALRPLNLSEGMLQVKAPVVINLSKEMVAKPISIPLEVRYGVSKDLELTLFHAQPIPGLAGGVCLGGTDRGCGKLYDNVGVGASYLLSNSGGLQLAGLAGVQISSIDASKMDAQIGVGVKHISGALSVAAAPKLYIGLNKRDEGNVKQAIALPVELAFQANAQLAAFVQTGIFGSTEKFGDNYVIPAGVGANYLVQHGLDVGAAFTLPALVTGMSGDKAMDARALTIYAAWRNL